MSVKLSISTEEMKAKFSALQTPKNVAELLEVKYAQLAFHLYKSTSSEKYTTFEIPKRSGGKREIKVPISPIKIIQLKLNEVLREVYKPKKPVHGFVCGRNIMSNARHHVNKRWVLNIDLKDFFPTISFRRIRGMFINRPYRIGEDAATVLAQICCCDGTLPQGAPTSPIISNLICSKLDSELDRMAHRYKCVYTRYADDLTFSTDEPVFPEALAKKKGDGSIIAGDEITKIISDNWFEINTKKVKLRKYDMRQEVTGLTVNKLLNVRRRYIKQIRAMLHAWERFGLDYAQTEYMRRHYVKKHRNPRNAIPKYQDILYGKICFLKQVIGGNNPVFLRYFKQFQRLELLNRYDEQKANTNAIERGLILEKLMEKLFLINNFEIIGSFRRNNNGEQIDGACKYDAHYYLIECKWQSQLSSTGDTDHLAMKVNRSTTNTMGLFISVNGWSTYVHDLLLKNPNKNVILMNGSDIEYVLKERVDLLELMQAKTKHLHVYAEPYFDAKKLLLS
jgi:RNA-directed DNA polymerase